MSQNLLMELETRTTHWGQTMVSSCGVTSTRHDAIQFPAIAHPTGDQ